MFSTCSKKATSSRIARDFGGAGGRPQSTARPFPEEIVLGCRWQRISRTLNSRSVLFCEMKRINTTLGHVVGGPTRDLLSQLPPLHFGQIRWCGVG